MLAAAHIHTLDELRTLGAVQTYWQVRQAETQRSGRAVSLNLLWALEGALTGLPGKPWHACTAPACCWRWTRLNTLKAHHELSPRLRRLLHCAIHQHTDSPARWSARHRQTGRRSLLATG
jgi:hypothetical protein